MSSSHEPSPVSEAMTWVSRIMAVSAVMILPGLAGQWLDKHWGVGFLGLSGFAVGLVSGIAYLLAITKLPHKLPEDGPPEGESPDASEADGANKDGPSEPTNR